MKRPKRSDVRARIVAGLDSPALSPRERRILRALYAPSDRRDASTLEEVGEAEQVTRERVRQIAIAALAKLGIKRPPGRSSSNPDHPFARWLDGRDKSAVASRLGVSVSTLNRLAAGTLLPNLELAAAIAAATEGVVGAGVWLKHKKSRKAA